MHFSPVRAFVPVIFLLCIYVAGCHKAETIVPPPVTDNDAKIQLLTPVDSDYFASNHPLEVTGKVTGTSKDYSYLNYYILTSPNRDTLARGGVAADGSIHSVLSKNPPAGEYRIFIAAGNKDPNVKTLESNVSMIFVGIPPPIKILSLTKDDTSISINWSKSSASNFSRYELYVTRTDTGRPTPPYPLGKLIATISDISQTSFKDAGIFFYYQYKYVVRQVTKDSLTSELASMSIAAGSYYTLNGHSFAIFDQVRNRFYHYSPDNSDQLEIIDPDLLTAESSTAIGTDKYLVGLDETGNNLNLIAYLAVDSFQVFNFDVNSHALTLKAGFRLTTAPHIDAVSNNFAFYQTPGKVQYYDMIGQSNTVLMQKSFISSINAFNNNTALVISFAANPGDPSDSFYVYNISPGNVQLVFQGISPNLVYSGANNTVIPYTASRIGIGGILYDQSFNPLGNLPGNDFIIGISQDGKYVVGASNKIYQTSDMTVVKTLGDGFYMQTAFFSNSGTRIYPQTGGSLGLSWNPPNRIFRYPLVGLP